MSAENDVLIRVADGVLEVVLNRPDEGNKVTEDMGKRIVHALSGTRPAYKVVLFRGEGGDFCAGRQSPTLDRSKATPNELRHVIAEGPLELYQAFRDCRAPIVGLIQGRAFGVGCALAALCDLTVCATNVRFKVPEMDAGIPPTLVISALANRVPYRIIQELVYLRDEMSATEARAFGLVNRIVANDALPTEGGKLIEKLKGNTVAALAAVKEYSLAATSSNTSVHMSLAASLISNVISTDSR